LRQIYGVPPVFADGKLYVVTGQFQFTNHPEGILVVDVASETLCTYGLPDMFVGPRGDTLVDVLELHGQFCLALNYAIVSPDRPKVEFWVMPRLGQLHGGNHMRLDWVLRYTFYVEVDHVSRKAAATPYVWGKHYKDQPRAAWLDEDEILCYMLDGCLYKYNTRDHSRLDDFVAWNEKVQLPTTPSPSNRRWNIYGGYRPSLLSPLTFALPSSQDDEDNGRFEHDMLRALRPSKLIRRPPNDHIGQDARGFSAEPTFKFNADDKCDKDLKERKLP
jgi:hypothetical protein